MIFPSIIAKDQKGLDTLLKKLRPHAKLLHLDVMDGRFVRNRSLDFDLKLPRGRYRAHLMHEEPRKWIEKNGKKVSHILFHLETADPSGTIKLIRKIKRRVGLVIKPETSVDKLRPYLKRVDEVLVMTVHPGKYGAKFLPAQLNKVREIKRAAPHLDVIVDGGMHPGTARLAAEAGADHLVSGSFVSKAKNPKKAILALQDEIAKRSITHKVKSKSEMYKNAAALIARKINKLALKKRKIIVGLCGGRSVPGVYEELAKKALPWKRLLFFMVDERLVPLDSKESNFRLAAKHLFAKAICKGLPEENARPVRTGKRPQAALREYSRALKKEGGRFDLIVLSAGEDGHVASLFPAHHSVKKYAKYFILVERAPKPPRRRVSASKSLLESSSSAILLFVGKGKARAYAKFFDFSIPPENCPAKLVFAIPDTHIFTDRS